MARPDKFSWEAGDVRTAVCFHCAHFQGNRSCHAFTYEIPNEVWSGENDHTKQIDGDQGILFKSHGTSHRKRRTSMKNQFTSWHVSVAAEAATAALFARCGYD